MRTVHTRLPALVPVGAANLSWIYPVSDSQVALFRKDGFVRFAGVLDPDILAALAQRLAHLESIGSIARRRDPYGRAFRYCMHAWLLDPAIQRVTLSRRLAGIAARLLETSTVRLSHDQAMFKDPGCDPTPIHADQYHWPISSNQGLSLWIPLQPTNLSMGPLSFYRGSHQIDHKKRVELEEGTQDNLSQFLSSHSESTEPYSLGDVSFHYGWTFHRAGPNLSNIARNAFGIVYVADGVRVAQPRNGVPIEALAHWSPGAKVGEPLSSDRNPVVFRHRDIMPNKALQPPLTNNCTI
jgi:Phytanoyl-CoA dioxygenase (PhyH)